MTLTSTMVAAAALLTVTLMHTVDAQQASQEAASARTIDISNAQPVLRSLEELRERYHVAITYEGPVYTCEYDLADMTYTRKSPGPKIIVPKRQRLRFEYAELGGKPQEDMTPLIHRLLAEYAAQGGPVFDVRDRTTPKGTQWNVVALKARGSSGCFVDQPDILGAPIFISEARRSGTEFLREMLQQLRTETGYRVVLGTVETKLDGEGTFGADNIPARDVLANLFGTDMVWDLNYDPEGEGKYILNLVWTPRPPQPLNAYTLAPRITPPQQIGPVRAVPGATLRHFTTTRHGRMELQARLAQAGYYDGEPSGAWDEQTVDALEKAQAANNLQVTGKLDPQTIRKLRLDVRTPPPH
jgi:hypothetical protein